MVGRLFALLEAQTAEFDARMDASARVVDRMTRSQTIAVRASGQVRAGLQGLANQAFATAGPLGQVASGLSQIVGGMAALTGAAAGGALFLYFTHLTKQLDEAIQKSDQLSTTWRSMVAARIGSPFLAMMAEREPMETQRDELQARINKRLAGLAVPGLTPEVQKQIIAGDATMSQWQRSLDAINGILDEIGRKPETILVGMRREVQLINLPLEEALRLQAEWAGLVGKTADEFVRLGTALAIAPLQEQGNQIQRDIQELLTGNVAKGIAPFALSPDIAPFVLGPGTDMMEEITKGRTEQLFGLGGGKDKGEFTSNIINQLVAQEQQRLQILDLMNNKTFMANLAAQGLTEEFDAMVRGMNRAELKSQQLAVAIVSSVSSAIQAIAGGGGPGSFISGAGGVMTALASKHPSLLVPGMIVGAFGGLISLFEKQHSERERNEEKRKNELIGAIHEGPVRVTEIFEGDPEMSRYERDRVERLGGGPSRMGQ